MIRIFKIVSEGGISAGVRRIEALTGERLLSIYSNIQNRAWKFVSIWECMRSGIPLWKVTTLWWNGHRKVSIPEKEFGVESRDFPLKQCPLTPNSFSGML